MLTYLPCIIAANVDILALQPFQVLQPGLYLSKMLNKPLSGTETPR